MFCQYKNILGTPSKGIHSQRIFGLAFWDIVMTIACALLIWKIFNWDLTTVLLSLCILGQVLHYMFCVDTALLTKTHYNNNTNPLFDNTKIKII